jgi:hypothetical protein
MKEVQSFEGIGAIHWEFDPNPHFKYHVSPCQILQAKVINLAMPKWIILQTEMVTKINATTLVLPC